MTAPFIAFDNSYSRLPAPFHLPQEPTPVPAPRLIAFNHRLAAELGLNMAAVNDDILAQYFSGSLLPEGASALAMSYAGHQFGHFVPTLGDGRAILLGEVVDRTGKRRDIQLKGAGQTPFSRRGDGRAALGPVLREYIVSEAMHALGVPATRALAAVSSGEAVYRETTLPGAIFTRVAASHIRVGTFQFLAARRDVDGLRQLADYVMTRHDPDLVGTENAYLALLTRIIERQASLIAQWMSFGFIHGVMNTDNMTVSGETIDFGPCAFLDEFDPAKKFSSIDQQGRYAYQNQPAIGQWNLTRLAECFLPLLGEDEEKAVADANEAVVGFAHAFNREWLARMAAKFGIRDPRPEDRALIEDFLARLHQASADFTLSFRALSDALADDDAARIIAGTTAPDQLPSWFERWKARLSETGQSLTEVANAMRQVNPALIPRNHRIEEVIEAAIENTDFAPFHALNRALENPFAREAETSPYAIPPAPEERVQATFCGT